MDTGQLSIFIAFAAGLLSFLSPCVLPIIPSYLCIIGGVSLGRTVEGRQMQYRVSDKPVPVKPADSCAPCRQRHQNRN
jgi:cytochrome c-type biogenesis protein